MLGMFEAPSFGCLWSAFGVPWADFGLLLTLLGTLGLPLGIHLAPLGVPVDPFEPHGAPLGEGPGFGTSPTLMYRKTQQDLRFWNTPPEPPEPREPVKWCQELRLGAHLPHAPGARMTVVTQTPSNK